MRKNKLLIRLISVLLLLALAGCGEVPAAKEPAGGEAICFTDDLGREVSVTSHQCVAVLIGSFADIWCIAGGKDSIVATANDSWTSFDLGLDESVQNLGAIKTPSVEVLLASQPDLVIGSCNTASNVEMEETLEAAGITVAYFDVQNFEDYLRMLDICTRITGQRGNYETYGTALKQQIEEAIARQDGSAPKVLCIRATGSSCKIKGSTDNLLGEMLTDLGCVNIADNENAILEELSMEAILQADPDYVFAVLQGQDSEAAMQAMEAALLSHPAWSTLRAVQTGNFYTLDNSLYNLKPNARWGEAYEKLADILYPAEN